MIRGIAVSRGEHQHRLAADPRALASAPPFSSASDDARIAIERGDRKRRRRLRDWSTLAFGAGLEQRLHHLGVVAVDGPVQRRRAVDLRRVDVGFLDDQCADGGEDRLSLPRPRPRSCRAAMTGRAPVQSRIAAQPRNCRVVMVSPAASHQLRQPAGAVTLLVLVDPVHVEDARAAGCRSSPTSCRSAGDDCLSAARWRRRPGCAARRSAGADSSCPCWCRT